MKRETIAIHAGYDGDPTTKAVAVPIYQTVAFEFDSAEHGAALFNLEVQGNIYTRIGNPTNTVLEKRVAALEGGVDGLSVSSGMAAIEYSLINIAEIGNNIVSTPQLYGATYTLLAHIFRKRGIEARFGATDKPEDIEKLIDENTRAVYCESVGNPAGNVADIEGLAREMCIRDRCLTVGSSRRCRDYISWVNLRHGASGRSWVSSREPSLPRRN